MCWSEALVRWLRAFRAGVETKLVSCCRGRPRGQSKLKSHMAATIVRLILDRCPDQLNLPMALWLQEAVREQNFRRTGVILPYGHWGYEPQKPFALLMRRKRRRDSWLGRRSTWICTGRPSWRERGAIPVNGKSPTEWSSGTFSILPPHTALNQFNISGLD